MTFLPIVQRELRVAARRRSTYTVRFWTAIIALAVSFFSLVFLSLAGRSRANIGNLLFANLTYYAFGICLLAGVFLTADSLSEEKRDGTLGLLFLTDLQGYDVVFGKFVAMLLRSLYGLLALLPILAISLLLGGVMGGEFARRALALINGLFVSLTGGILVSSLVRDADRAMRNSFGLILILVAAVPALILFGSQKRFLPAISWLGWVSPFYPFSYSSAPLYFNHSGKFWEMLAASHGLGWIFLALASRVLPYRWQEQADGMRSTGLLERLLQRYQGLPEKRREVRRELLPINPITWLVSREPGFEKLAWLILLVWAGFVGVATISAPGGAGKIVLSGMRPFGFLLKALFTVQVCRFFAGGRRSGALEMLLSTPLTNRGIIRGQSMAVRRTFLWPSATFLALLFVPIAAQVMSGMYSLNLKQLMGGGVGFVECVINAVRMVADFFALFWVGLWLALTMKRPAFAPALTILSVLILPAFLCYLDIFADLLLILWAATRLQQDLRWVLARQYQTSSEIPLSSALLRPVAPIPPLLSKR